MSSQQTLATDLPSHMTIVDLAKHVWLNSHIIEFHQVDCWSDDLFTATWANTKDPKLAWRTYTAGWYWFLAKMSLSDLCAVQRPDSLPKRGCDIGALSRTNSEIFGTELLCGQSEEGQVVVYSGHESMVCSRVRAHFALMNNQTGALGLKHFPLHDRGWQVRVFAAPCLQSLPTEAHKRVVQLMNSYSGRCAVETAWRAVYGWPALCKE